MKTPLRCSLLLFGLAALAACVEEEVSDPDTGDAATSTDGNASDSSDPSDPTNGGVLDPMCEPNAGDGLTNCDGEICEAGSYCAALFCEAGCETTLNCPAGQWCDLRMPDGFGAGLCRPTSDPACGGPGSADSSTTDVGGEDCSDVEGNYVLGLHASSPQECGELFSGISCSVAQEGCTLSWGCGSENQNLFPPGPLAADDTFTTDGMLEGVAYSCTFDFGDPMGWSCSFTTPEGTLVCQGPLN